MISKVKENKIALVLLILILFMVCIGISYSLWKVNLFQTTANTLATDCFNITFTEANNIELLNTYPMYDEDGSKLTPYTFTIKNNCASYATYQVQLEILNTSTLSDQYLKVMLDTKTPDLLTNYKEGEITLENAKSSYILDNNALDKNEEKTYNLRVWLDENVTLETEGVQNSTWSAKVTITAKYSDHLPSEYERCMMEYDELVYCGVLAQLDTTGKCPTLQEDGTVELTSSENKEGYVCSAPDDYGTSYYFRGNVTNNYVKFGKNENEKDMYWRIIRINGDGSVRMIYDGTSAYANGEENADRYIGTSIFNEIICSSEGPNRCLDSEYYTYNNHQNDSIVKSYVDDWYERVFLGSDYEPYLSDEIFCSSRVLDDYVYKLTDNLSCIREEDRYTVDEIKGNGGLTYPIGLLTVTEGRIAGGVGITGVTGHYLDAGIYWTMSPVYVSDSYGSAVYTMYYGMASAGPAAMDVTTTSGVRPVINLKPNSLNTGDGTASNPYRIEE